MIKMCDLPRYADADMEEIKKIYNIDGGMVIPQSDTDYLTDQVILNNIIS